MISPHNAEGNCQSNELRPNEAQDDPHRLARSFLNHKCSHDDGYTLRHWREQWHRWDGTAYRTLSEIELRAEVTENSKSALDRANVITQRASNQNRTPTVRKVTGRLVSDVENALTSLTILPSSVEAPAWLGDSGRFLPHEMLACRNALVNLPSFADGRAESLRPTPQFFSLNCLDFDFDPAAPKPIAWLDFLQSLWSDDTQSIDTLQEWIGYLLTPDTRQQKIMMMIGPKRSGKGTIARIIRHLVGPRNVACPTLAEINGQFGMAPLVGKSVATFADLRLSDRVDVAGLVERLLSISGEDPKDIHRKFLPTLSGVKLYARFMLLSNELPHLNDPSGALAGRMVLLRLTRSWFDREDIGLEDRLVKELPGILLWAIEGWKRLRLRGRFIQPDSGRSLIGDLADLASPVGAFVQDCCKVGPGYRIVKGELFVAWKKWCDEHGRDAGSDGAFGKDLFAAVPSIKSSQSRAGNSDGKRPPRSYEGICLVSQ
jgi:putative DNA primase/helicase